MLPADVAKLETEKVLRKMGEDLRESYDNWKKVVEQELDRKEMKNIQMDSINKGRFGFTIQINMGGIMTGNTSPRNLDSYISNEISNGYYGSPVLKIRGYTITSCCLSADNTIMFVDISWK